EHRRRPDRQRFAAANDVVEGCQRFLDGGRRVEAVNLIEVDVVHLQSTEAVVDGVADVFAGEAALVRRVAHGVEDLGRDDDLLAGNLQITDRPAENLFADAQRVHVGGVEEV